MKRSIPWIFALTMGIANAATMNAPMATIFLNKAYGNHISYFKDAQNCMGETALVEHYAFGSKSGEVPANRKITLAAGYDDGSMSCEKVVFSFVPKAGQKYRVSYGFDYKNSSNSCQLTIINLTTNQKVSFQPRQFKEGFFTSGKCVSKLFSCHLFYSVNSRQ